MIYMSVIKQGLLKIQIEHLLYQQATKGYFTYTQPFHLKMHSTAVWPIWQRPYVFYLYFHTYYYYFTRILFSPSQFSPSYIVLVCYFSDTGYENLEKNCWHQNTVHFSFEDVERQSANILRTDISHSFNESDNPTNLNFNFLIILMPF